MARRSVWLVTGVVAGAASSLYAERKLRRTLEAASARLQPDALVSEVGRSARQAARSTGGRVREAMATGRREMQRREEELWAGLATGTGDATPGADAPGDATAAPGVPGSVESAVPPAESSGTGPVEAPVVAAGHPRRGRSRRSARRSPSHLGK